MYIRLPQRGIQHCGVQSVSLKLDYNVFLPLYYLPNTNYCGCYLSVVSKNVYMYITKHSSALYIGIAKVLPIIDVLGYDGQNSSFSSSSSSSSSSCSDSTPITQKGSHIST